MSFDLLEIIGVTLSIITLVLDVHEKVLARPLGLLGGLLSFFVYYPAGLYAKCLLNGFFFFMNVYGWYHWLYGGHRKTPLQVSRTKPRLLAGLLLAGTVGTLVLGSLLRHTQAVLVYWDALHAMLCLAAQWLLVQKKLESWPLWIVADVLYTILLYHQGLYLFGSLRVLYTLLAINGYRTWHQAYHQAQKPPASAW